MRIASLSDVHGNLPALRAVLAEIEREGVDLVVLGGDHAAGPFPAETLDLLIGLGERARFIRGNADRELVEAADDPNSAPRENGPPALAWAVPRLDSRHWDFLRALPESVAFEVDGLGRTLFCHGSPRTDMEVLTAGTPESRVRDALGGVEASAVVCGHTHMQFERELDGKRVLNPGSVGLPYEGEPGAYWAVLGPGVEFRRTLYDNEATAALVRETDYPDVEQFVAEFILASHAREETIEFFEQLALDDQRFAGASG